MNHHHATLSNYLLLLMERKESNQTNKNLTVMKLRNTDKKVSEYDQEIPSSIPAWSHTFMEINH